MPVAILSAGLREAIGATHSILVRIKLSSCKRCILSDSPETRGSLSMCFGNDRNKYILV